MLGAKLRGSSVLELRANLKELAKKVERQAMREELTKASTVMVNEAKVRAPVDKVANGGDLRKAMKRRVTTSKDKKTVIVVIGPDRKARGKDRRGNVSRPTNYAHLQEFGTSTQSAKPFMRPAFDAKKGEVLTKFADGMEPAIQRVAARVNKRKPI